MVDKTLDGKVNLIVCYNSYSAGMIDVLINY